MRSVLTLLPLLGCLGMMYVCGRMLFGHRAENDHGAEEINELRSEVARLRAKREDAGRE